MEILYPERTEKRTVFAGGMRVTWRFYIQRGQRRGQSLLGV